MSYKAAIESADVKTSKILQALYYAVAINTVFTVGCYLESCKMHSIHPAIDACRKFDSGFIQMPFIILLLVINVYWIWVEFSCINVFAIVLGISVTFSDSLMQQLL